MYVYLHIHTMHRNDAPDVYEVYDAYDAYDAYDVCDVYDALDIYIYMHMYHSWFIIYHALFIFIMDVLCTIFYILH